VAKKLTEFYEWLLESYLEAGKKEAKYKKEKKKQNTKDPKSTGGFGSWFWLRL